MAFAGAVASPTWCGRTVGREARVDLDGFWELVAAARGGWPGAPGLARPARPRARSSRSRFRNRSARLAASASTRPRVRGQWHLGIPGPLELRHEASDGAFDPAEALTLGAVSAPRQQL